MVAYEREPLTLSDDLHLRQRRIGRRWCGARGRRWLDVFIGGGAEIINEYLAAGMLDEVELHVGPILLGGGARLFAGVGQDVKLGRSA